MIIELSECEQIIEVPKLKHPCDQYSFPELVEMLETQKPLPFWMVCGYDPKDLANAIKSYRAIKE